MPDPVAEEPAAVAQPTEEIHVEVIEITPDGQEHVIDSFTETHQGPLSPEELAAIVHDAESGHAAEAQPATADPDAPAAGEHGPATVEGGFPSPDGAATPEPAVAQDGGLAPPPGASAAAPATAQEGGFGSGGHPAEIIEVIEIVEVHDAGTDVPVAHADAPATDEPAAYHDGGTTHDTGAEDYADAFYHDHGTV